MSERTQPPIRNHENLPIPQYFNADYSTYQGRVGRYEATEGKHGAMACIKLGTVAMEWWEGSEDVVKAFGSNRHGFSITNEGNNDLTFTIHDQTRTIKPGEKYKSLFIPFNSVTIRATSEYEAEVFK